MKENIVYTHSCAIDNLKIERNEILRYMSCKEETEDVNRLIDEFLPEAMNSFSFKGSFVYVPVAVKDSHVTVADNVLKSKSISKNLGMCHHGVVFALSIGAMADRLIEKYSRLRPLAALCINAISNAAIESYADAFCKEISAILKNDKLYARPRFSPGYGDLPIESQPFFLKLTNASRLVGISLSDKFMMMPSKSITAIMGVSDINTDCIHRGCEECLSAACIYRR